MAKAKKSTAARKSTKSTKKAPKGKSKAKASGDTVRVRAFKALVPKDLTAAQVQEAIGLSHSLKPTLDEEVERGHLAYTPNAEAGGRAVYHITAKGKKALKAGTTSPERGSA